MKPKFHKSFVPLVSVLASLLTSQSIHAATYYWDTTGNTVGFGTATGTWASPTASRWGNSVSGQQAPPNVTTLNTNGATDALNFGFSTLGIGAGTITVSGTVASGNMTFAVGSGAVVLSGGQIDFSAAPIITVDNITNTISSIIGGAATSFTKTGAGTLVLTGANSYTGSTIVSAGAIDLGGTTATGSLASTTLTLNGGSFRYTRTGTNTQTFTTTSINSSSSTISGAAGNTLNLGTVIRGTGAALDFSTAGLALISASTFSHDATGIMAGFTFGDSWAVANEDNVSIIGLASGDYTLSSAAGDTASLYNDLNIDVDSSQIPDDSMIVNSLRFSESEANTLTLQGSNFFTSGGIIVGSGVGANLSTITGGTLAGAASKDLSIYQNNTAAGLTIDSEITNSGGATALTKSGAGLLTLTNSNTFTGGVFIHGGQILMADAGALNSNAGSQNAVTFGVGSTGRLTLNGNNTVLRSLASSATPVTAIVENASGADITLTIGNSANASGAYGGVIQDGSGGGKLALTKVGSGTLTLFGANTYTGDTTISAGIVAISNAASFGTSNVLVTGSSRINVASGLTYANPINVGAALQLQNPRPASTGTATYSGPLTGSSSITIVGGEGNGIIAEHAFTSASNTFTGNVIFPAGSVTGHDFFSFNSIGDGGTFTFQKSGHQSTVAYTGTSAITFNSRQIAIGAAFNNMFDGGGVTPINSFRNNTANAANTVTFNSNITPGAIAGNGSFFFGGSNTGNNTFAGIISNPTSGGNLGIGKSDGGKWILTGNSSYLGNVKISGGTLAVSTMAATTTNQPLGRGGIVEIGHQNTTGTLEYIGSSDATTNKQVQMGNVNANPVNACGAIILNNGSGSLTFNNTTFNAAATTVTATRPLTLGGTYTTGVNQIQGIIQDNVASTGRVSLSKTGSGTWALSGANTYSGGSSVSGGTLIFRNTAAKPTTGTHAFSAGTTLGLGVGAAGFFSEADITNSFAGTMTGNLSGITVNATTNVGIDTTAGDFLYSTSVAGSPAKGLRKLGSGKLTLTGANTYTGATTVSEGTLALVGGSQESPITVSAGASLGFTLDSPTTSTSTFNLSAGTIQITGSATLASYDLITSSAGITGTPVLHAPIAGYELKVEGNSLKLKKTGYAAWAAINAIGSTPAQDKDGDGVSNAIEYVLGGSVITNDLDKLPQSNISGTNLIFTFKRKAETADSSTVVTIEVDTDLSGWETSYAVPDTAVANNPGVTVVEDDPTGFDTITLTLPMGTDPKKFARLRVAVTE